MQVSDKHTAGNSAISNNINSHLCICQSDIKEIVNLPASDDYDFVDIKFANNNLGYFLIDNKLFATTDLGENFTPIYVNSKEDRFDNLFISNDIIALITTQGYWEGYTISTNGGKNWNINDSINKHSLQLLKSNLIYGTDNTFGTKETFPEAYPENNGKLRENYDNSMNIYYEKDTCGVTNANMISDSLLKPLNENEVGLLGCFPPNWKQMDSRRININQKEFTGVLLLDTAVKNKEAALTMNIQLDPKGEYWSQFTFKNIFEEDSLRTIYSFEPESEANQTYYRFYLAGKTDNVFISAFVESTYFEKYKPEIELVVRSIRIQQNQKSLW